MGTGIAHLDNGVKSCATLNPCLATHTHIFSIEGHSHYLLPVPKEKTMGKDSSSPEKELRWWEKKKIVLPHSRYTQEQIEEYRAARKDGMSSLKPRVPLGSKPKFRCLNTMPGRTTRRD